MVHHLWKWNIAALFLLVAPARAQDSTLDSLADDLPQPSALSLDTPVTTPQDPSSPFKIEVSMVSEPTVRFSKLLPTRLTYREANVSLDMGTVNLDRVIDEFGLRPSQMKWGYDLSFKGTVKAILSEHQASIDKNHSIDDYVKLNGPAIVRGVYAPLAAQIDAAPGLSDVQKAQLKAETLRNVQSQLRSNVEKLKSETDQRLDYTVWDLSFQEVAYGVEHIVGDDEAIIYAKVGKMQVSAAAPSDSSGHTALDDFTLTNVRAQRLGGASSTGNVMLGLKQNLGNGASIEYRVDYYHDRLAYVNEAQFFSDISNLSEDRYEREKRFWSLDAVDFKTIVRNKKFDVYFAASDHHGHPSFNGGMVVRVSESGTIFLDAVAANIEQLNGYGVSLFYGQRLTQNVRALAGVEYYSGSWEPLYTAQTTDIDRRVSYMLVRVGVNADVATFKIGKDGKLRLNVGIEGQYRTATAGIDDEPIGYVGGRLYYTEDKR